MREAPSNIDMKNQNPQTASVGRVATDTEKRAGGRPIAYLGTRALTTNPSAIAGELLEKGWRKERLNSEKILAFLQRKFDALSPFDRAAMLEKNAETLRGAVSGLLNKCGKMPGLKLKDDVVGLAVNLVYHNDAFYIYGGPCIEWASADADAQTVYLLTLSVFAPKDVLRGLVVHEVLHLLYPMLDPECLPADLPLGATVAQYPEEQQREEQWVRNMTRRAGYPESLLLAWELAVETQPENWRPIYYMLKKNLPPSEEGKHDAAPAGL